MSDEIALCDCGGCGAKPGELHQPGCDVERCVLCGGQANSCSCVYEVNGLEEGDLEEEHPTVYKYGPTEAMLAVLEEEEEKHGGRLPWTGEYPGRTECREFGWYSKWVEGEGWVRCEKDDPGAGPDLNRLNAGDRAEWSRDKRRWVLR